jgi:hypothetical protein
MQFKLSIILITLLVFFKPAKAQLKEVQGFVLAQKQTGLGNSVRQREVVRIFQGKYTRWPQTQVLVTIVMPSSKHPNALAVCKIMGYNSFKEMQKYWLSMVFQGRFSAPVFLDTDQEIIDYVLRNSGAVGIISTASISNTLKDTYSLIFE